jgi:hypothetical protein
MTAYVQEIRLDVRRAAGDRPDRGPIEVVFGGEDLANVDETARTVELDLAEAEQLVLALTNAIVGAQAIDRAGQR